MSKKSPIVLLLVLLSISAIAQRDSGTHSLHDYKQSLVISAGVGISTMYTIVENPLDLAGSGVNMISVGPAYNCMLDYRITKRGSYGIAIAYQQLSYNPGYDNANTASWFIDNANRLNAGFRFLEHFYEYPNSDLYMGVRVGASFWSYDRTLSPAYQYSPSTLIPVPPLAPSRTVISLQVLIGFKAYLSDNIGLHVEAGLGTPYFAEAGVSYRIYTGQ